MSRGVDMLSLVGERQHFADERGSSQRRVDRADRVADVEEAALVGHTRERQPAARGDRFQQLQEITFHAGPVDQRHAQHHSFDAAGLRDFQQHVLGFGLAHRVRAAGMRWIPCPKRATWRRRVAVDLDGARQDHATHSGGHRGVEKTTHHMDIGDDVRRGTCGALAQHVRATREMNDGGNAGERRVPIRGGEIAERHAPRAHRLAGRVGAHHGDMLDTALREMRAQGVTDETIRSGHQDLAGCRARHAHFQPCLLKKRTPLRVKYAMWCKPLRAARPP